MPLTWHYCHKLEGHTLLVPLLNTKGSDMSDEMLGKRDVKPEDGDTWFEAHRAERRRRKCDHSHSWLWHRDLLCVHLANG